MSDLTGTQWLILLIALIALVGYMAHLVFRDEEKDKKPPPLDGWTNLPRHTQRLTLRDWSANQTVPEDVEPPTESGVPRERADR